MKWMMILCAVPLIILLFAQGGGGTSGLTWLLIGGFVLVHLIMMFKGHGRQSDIEEEDKSNEPATQETKTKGDEHQHGGCCH